jgi:hypothetical protein
LNTKTLLLTLLTLTITTLAQGQIVITPSDTTAIVSIHNEDNDPFSSEYARFTLEFEVSNLEEYDLILLKQIHLDDPNESSVAIGSGIHLLPSLVSSAEVEVTSSFLELVSGRMEETSLGFEIDAGYDAIFRLSMEVQSTESGVFGLKLDHMSFRGPQSIGNVYVHGLQTNAVMMNRSVPEPTTAGLLMLGMIGVVARRARRN